jgi:toluene monooxygenase system protein E
VSTDLHYNYPFGFELPKGNSVVDWYYRYREGSALSADWEQFSDPRATTYRGYTELQDRKEDMVDGLLREEDNHAGVPALAGEWLHFLDLWYAPLRYPVHALQMLAAYIGQMAPTSRITNCAAFQSADEMRRVQRIAYRSAQLASREGAHSAEEHRRQWEQASEFQPLRELAETALIVYDWAESFVVTNLVIKPLIDRLINQEIAGVLAASNHDTILQSVHFSLDEDAAWHRDWTNALLKVALKDSPENAELVASWILAWRPRAENAVSGLAEVVTQAPVPLDAAQVRARVAGDAAETIG